jgi:outer membrane lipoprotein-sorting protein
MLKPNNFLKASAVFCLLLSAASCGLWRSPESGSEEPPPTPEAASNIPFLTKDPEVFQANVLVQSFASDGKSTSRKYFVARNGTGLLVRFAEGADDERTLLRLENGESFILYFKSRTYKPILNSRAADDIVREVAAGWLAATPGTRFEKISTEGSISKYAVELEGSESSETFIYYDEELGYPVKQEMFTSTGGKVKLAFRYTVSGFKLEADKGLFKIPKEYRPA